MTINSIIRLIEEKFKDTTTDRNYDLTRRYTQIEIITKISNALTNNYTPVSGDLYEYKKDKYWCIKVLGNKNDGNERYLSLGEYNGLSELCTVNLGSCIGEFIFVRKANDEEMNKIKMLLNPL